MNEASNYSQTNSISLLWLSLRNLGTQVSLVHTLTFDALVFFLTSHHHANNIEYQDTHPNLPKSKTPLPTLLASSMNFAITRTPTMKPTLKHSNPSNPKYRSLTPHRPLPLLNLRLPAYPHFTNLSLCFNHLMDPIPLSGSSKQTVSSRTTTSPLRCACSMFLLTCPEMLWPGSNGYIPAN